MKRRALLLSALLLPLAHAADCTFPHNLSGVQVWGLSSSAAGAASPSACAAACCASGGSACDTWQWCAGGQPAPTAGCGASPACWIGVAGSAQRARVPGWISYTSASTASDRFIDVAGAAPPPPPQPIAGLPAVTNRATGAVLSIDTASLLLDGHRILPFAGEMHLSRTPRASWAADLAAMKAGGLSIVQAYVFWLHTEEVRGQQAWDDNRALGAFVDAAAAAGLLVALRIGPWCHGEARNGGWPDWVGQQPGVKVRSNTTAWLELVQPWYAGVAAQISGKFWQDGGPIISVQLDNETPDVDYLLALRKLAVAEGITPWIFIKTGWPTPNEPVFVTRNGRGLISFCADAT